VPQFVPFATLTVDPHTGWPVVHEIVPVWQRSPPGLQVMFGVQALQVPLKQVKFVPHDIPLATFVFASLQTGVPVPHASVPLWQTLLGLQGEPSAQAMHVPLLQTMPAPQLVPLATLPVDMHTDEPVAQDVVPVAQTFPPGMQSWFGVQVLQLPFEQ
jgi:hypothetical protein